MTNNSSPTAKKSTWPLWVTFALFFVPVLIAYVMYFYIRPDIRNNYGTLIEPQLDIPAQMELKTLAGDAFDLSTLKGKWVLLQVADSQCDETCQMMMFYQRQIRTSTGKEMTRLERVVLVTDNGPLETMLLRQFDGVHFVRASAEQVKAWLPAGQEMTKNGSPAQLKDHIFMIDPLGHVMLRFPPDIEHAKMRKDISRLLWASKIG